MYLSHAKANWRSTLLMHVTIPRFQYAHSHTVCASEKEYVSNSFGLFWPRCKTELYYLLPLQMVYMYISIAFSDVSTAHWCCIDLVHFLNSEFVTIWGPCWHLLHLSRQLLAWKSEWASTGVCRTDENFCKKNWSVPIVINEFLALIEYEKYWYKIIHNLTAVWVGRP